VTEAQRVLIEGAYHALVEELAASWATAGATLEGFEAVVDLHERGYGFTTEQWADVRTRLTEARATHDARTSRAVMLGCALMAALRDDIELENRPVMH